MKFFGYGELVPWIIKCHKLKSHPDKNIFVKELNKGACDLVYNNLNDSKELFQGDGTLDILKNMFAFKSDLGKDWLPMSLFRSTHTTKDKVFDLIIDDNGSCENIMSVKIKKKISRQKNISDPTNRSG